MESENSLENKNGTIESWVKLYTSSLYNWALFKTSDKEYAEDLVQDTFLAAYQQLSGFEQKSSPKTWLMAILNNKIKSFYRTKYKGVGNTKSEESNDDQIFSQLFNDNDRWRKSERPLAWEFDETHLLDDHDFNQILALCISRLPATWASAINLKYMEEKKGEQICQELGIAPTNFWQILHRGKLQLRKCLDVNWFKA